MAKRAASKAQSSLFDEPAPQPKERAKHIKIEAPKAERVEHRERTITRIELDLSTRVLTIDCTSDETADEHAAIGGAWERYARAPLPEISEESKAKIASLCFAHGLSTCQCGSKREP